MSLVENHSKACLVSTQKRKRKNRAHGGFREKGSLEVGRVVAPGKSSEDIKNFTTMCKASRQHLGDGFTPVHLGAVTCPLLVSAGQAWVPCPRRDGPGLQPFARVALTRHHHS